MITWLIPVIAIMILLVLSAAFSASETAVIASSRARLQNLVKKGDKRAEVIVHLRRNMGRLISSLLVGGTLINISASTIATGVLVRVFGDAGIAYATLSMGILIVFYGEVMPKIYAINNPEGTATRFSILLNLVVRFLSPVTYYIDRFAHGTLHLLGVKTSASANLTTTAEELRGLIELHVGPGKGVMHERAMLRGILDLSTVDVDEIMTHRKNLLMFDIAEPVEKIMEQMLEGPYTRIPLWQDNPDNIVGILHAKELFNAFKKVEGTLAKINIRRLLSKPWFIPESTSLLDQLQAFRTRREHFALVVDEYGALMGVVTLEDILEEIVGEIVDEYDVELPGVRATAGGTITAEGSVTIRDLNRQFEWSLPDDEAATVAGLVMYEAHRIPEVGQVFKIHNFKFEVLRRQRNLITRLRIIPPASKKSRVKK